ncbi:MAG: hypothetical protein KUG77_00575 [Nannocystaceae bacterium]|nr:hypothetical protein [Nannocystaceae bacterium]
MNSYNEGERSLVIFEDRKTKTDEVFSRLQSHLETTLGPRRDEVIGDHSFVYVTGSCGRGEMGEFSDLDAYVVRIGEDNPEHDQVLRDGLFAANAAAGLPPLDGKGRHIKTTQASQLVDRLGAPDDDTRKDGLFTKRMLLLLESRVMLGEAAYAEVLRKVTDAYWQNSETHRSDYQPFVLVNDIVRWWRIVLLNHESELRREAEKLEARGELTSDRRATLLFASRRYRSYKMRLARCLTCFSGLAYLLALTPSETAHVSQDDIYEMVALTPLGRLGTLEAVAGQPLSAVVELQEIYASYLERMDAGKEALVEGLEVDPDLGRELSREGGRFTELMFALVQELGGGRRLHRHMLV